MKNKQILLTAAVFSVFTMCAAAPTPKEPLTIYLPREVTIDSSTAHLGQIAIIRGSDPWAAQAAEVSLGRIPSLDHGLVLNKSIILSRLACSGIPASRVVMTGAEETIIHYRHQRFKSDQLIEEVTAFVKRNLPNPSICQFDVVGVPEDLVLSGPEISTVLTCRFLDHKTKNQCKVQIAAVQDNQEVGTREVVLRFRYKYRRAVTTSAIAKGTLITQDNIAIKDETSNFPEPAGWAPPYGLIATRDLAANTVLTEHSAGVAKPEIVLKRNQSVVIKIDRPGLMATANGKVMQDGKVGEVVKVQNITSQAIVMARVNGDGTVEPVF
jgi:flagellar basal body P-ring formation protein FlgA